MKNLFRLYLHAICVLAGFVLVYSAGCDGTTIGWSSDDPAEVYGTITGCVFDEVETDGGFTLCLCENTGPAPGATISLYEPTTVEYDEDAKYGDGYSCSTNYERPEVASTTADEAGRYSLKVKPGVYHLIHNQGCAPHWAWRNHYTCINLMEGDLNLDVDACAGVACLPNIYLYPERPMEVFVSLHFEDGAYLIANAPAFESPPSWRVEISTDGTIQGVDHHFLFYEAYVGLPSFLKRGWVVPPHGFLDWATSTLSHLGWNEREIEDFLKAWWPRLDENRTFLVYLIPPDWVASRVDLSITPQPDEIVRHWFYIERVDHKREHRDMQPPYISKPQRRGFSVLEWGVVKSW